MRQILIVIGVIFSMSIMAQGTYTQGPNYIEFTNGKSVCRASGCFDKVVFGDRIQLTSDDGRKFRLKPAVYGFADVASFNDFLNTVYTQTCSEGFVMIPDDNDTTYIVSDASDALIVSTIQNGLIVNYEIQLDESEISIFNIDSSGLKQLVSDCIPVDLDTTVTGLNVTVVDDLVSITVTNDAGQAFADSFTLNWADNVDTTGITAYFESLVPSDNDSTYIVESATDLISVTPSVGGLEVTYLLDTLGLADFIASFDTNTELDTFGVIVNDSIYQLQDGNGTIISQTPIRIDFVDTNTELDTTVSDFYRSGDSIYVELTNGQLFPLYEPVDLEYTIHEIVNPNTNQVTLGLSSDGGTTFDSTVDVDIRDADSDTTNELITSFVVDTVARTITIQEGGNQITQPYGFDIDTNTEVDTFATLVQDSILVVVDANNNEVSRDTIRLSMSAVGSMQLDTFATLVQDSILVLVDGNGNEVGRDTIRVLSEGNTSTITDNANGDDIGFEHENGNLSTYNVSIDTVLNADGSKDLTFDFNGQLLTVCIPPCTVVSSINATSANDNETFTVSIGQFKADGIAPTDCDNCASKIGVLLVDENGDTTRLADLNFNKGDANFTETTYTAGIPLWDTSPSAANYVSNIAAGDCGGLSNGATFDFDYKAFGLRYCIDDKNIMFTHGFCEGEVTSNASAAIIEGGCTPALITASLDAVSINQGSDVYYADFSSFRILWNHEGVTKTILQAGVNWSNMPIPSVGTAFATTPFSIDIDHGRGLVNGHPALFLSNQGGRTWWYLEHNGGNSCTETDNWIATPMQKPTRGDEVTEGTTASYYLHADPINYVNGRSIMYGSSATSTVDDNFVVTALTWDGAAWQKNPMFIPKSTIPVETYGTLNSTGSANAASTVSVYKINNPAATGNIKHNDIVVLMNTISRMIVGSYNSGPHEDGSSYTWRLENVSGMGQNASAIRDIQGVPLANREMGDYVTKLEDGEPIFYARNNATSSMSKIWADVANSTWTETTIYTPTFGVMSAISFVDSVNVIVNNVNTAFEHLTYQTAGQAQDQIQFICYSLGNDTLGGATQTESWGDYNQECNNCIPQATPTPLVATLQVRLNSQTILSNDNGNVALFDSSAPLDNWAQPADPQLGDQAEVSFVDLYGDDVIVTYSYDGTAWVITDTHRDEYFDVAAVVRIDGNGDWFILEDATHTPINTTSISNAGSGSGFVITHLPASELGAIQVTKDEVFVKAGLDGGARAGASTIQVDLSVGNANWLIRHTGASWQVLNTGNYEIIDESTITTTYNDVNGRLTVEHPAGMNISLYGRQLTARGVNGLSGNTYIPILYNTTATQTVLRFWDMDNNEFYNGAPNANMSFTYSIPTALTPTNDMVASLPTAILNLANFWVYARHKKVAL